MSTRPAMIAMPARNNSRCKASLRRNWRCKIHGETVTVCFHAGTYYLPETIVFTAADSGTEKAPVTYAAAPGEEAVISGGMKLDLKWEPYKDGIRAGYSSDGTDDRSAFRQRRTPAHGAIS